MAAPRYHVRLTRSTGEALRLEVPTLHGETGAKEQALRVAALLHPDDDGETKVISVKAAEIPKCAWDAPPARGSERDRKVA